VSDDFAADDGSGADPLDPIDAARWDAVEEATELLLDGQPHQVVALLGDVLARDAQNAYAYHYLGTALFDLERYDAARDAYRAAVLASPAYLGARVGLVHALRLSGDANSAIAAAKETLRLFPDDPDALFALGLALGADGQRQAGARALEQFLTTRPEIEVQMEAQGLIDWLRQGDEGEPLVWNAASHRSDTKK
jgi:tetratricopeptide (TPR) repeat protein